MIHHPSKTIVDYSNDSEKTLVHHSTHPSYIEMVLLLLMIFAIGSAASYYSALLSRQWIYVFMTTVKRFQCINNSR